MSASSTSRRSTGSAPRILSVNSMFAVGHNNRGHLPPGMSVSWRGTDRRMARLAAILPHAVGPVDHHIEVDLADRRTVVSHDFREASAWFLEPRYHNVLARPLIRVAVAGRSADEVIGLFAHEMAHYRQWSRTGRTSERGVAVLGRSIAKAIRREMRR